MPLTPPPAVAKHPDILCEMLRLAREKREAADRALSYNIALAREHNVPWADIANTVGLSELTCRRRLATYLGEREDAA